MASSQKSSFQKSGAVRSNFIKGCNFSIHNSQLLVSSGISSFDDIIGGGVPVGSLLLINEDECGLYAKLLVKYFLAEGIVSENAVFLASEDVKPSEMIQELPAPVDSQEDAQENEATDRKLTIAWRYENLKTTSSLDKHKHFGHYFDLSRNMDPKVLENSDVTLFSQNEVTSYKSFSESIYFKLLKSIEKKLKDGLYFAKQANTERNVLRIALFHANSPLWQSDDCEGSENHILIFLYYLRALIRNAYATCYITLPFSQYKKNLMEKCIHFADISVQLQSFAGTDCENVAPYKDYHGFFIIQKLAAINTMVAYNPQTNNFAFKLRRKKFVIEAFVLPPELENSTEREQDDSVLMCSSSRSRKYDF